MTSGGSPDRRGVTRGYVGGLIAAFVMVATALVVAVWGMIAVAANRAPVDTPGVWVLAAQLIVGIALALLAWGLWRQTIDLLRGRRTPPWGHTVAITVGGYLVWCLLGTLFGLSIAETWVSPFAIAIALVWAVCSLGFWAVLARRVYTDRPVPRWPWERGDDDAGGPGSGAAGSDQ